MTQPKLTKEEQALAVTRGVEWAFMNVLDATGGYSITRQAILDAVREGVHDAFVEIFGKEPDGGGDL
jgi:hypothetical protein